ncbi:MAG: YhgE/Pip domain-containing protein [Bifidobacterium sp.]|jgi:putative membrane protein
MRNVFTIVHRDVLRMLRVPAAWVIAFGIVFLPPLYAWFNIVGFWNPYGNTRGISVAVVNNDKGADSHLMGKISLGKDIVHQLHSDQELGWHFTNEARAMTEVKSGTSYAAIVIPSDFSSGMSAIASGSLTHPTIDYYVNEKANAIATKVTDTGASTVDRQINSTFVATVSKVVAEALNRTGDSIYGKASTLTASTIADLTTTQRAVATIRSTMHDMETTVGATPAQTKQARATLAATQQLGANAANGLSATSQAIGTAQTGLNSFVGSSSQTLDESSNLLSQASATTNLAISKISAGFVKANGDVGKALTLAHQVNDDNAQIIATLENLNVPGSSTIIDQLKAQNQVLGTLIGSLEKLGTDTSNTATSTSDAADALNTATQKTLSSVATARTTLASGSLPELNSGLTSLAGSASSLSAEIASQKSLISQTSIVLDQLDKAAAATLQTLSETDQGLSRVQDRLGTLITDLTALRDANAMGSGPLSSILGTDGKLNASKITDFMLSPTVLTTTTMYPVASYGSGMAPLFTNLSLWVGAFVLMVIVKLEVDDEGIDNPTAAERYWARWILLAVLAVAQGLATTIGELIIGVQSVAPALFVLTGVITALVFLSITYALSTTFLHAGKALCIALVIVQIPGASGIYPIEMMPHFFQVLYPLFPFTYSIDAMRETIGGFYDSHWGTAIGQLLIFAVVFFAIGLLVRPRLVNLNRMFARELAETDMIVAEPVQLPGHEFPISQALTVLANKEEYRKAIERRARNFTLLYPRLKRGALIAGVVVPIALAVTFSLTTGTKLVALSAWFIWVLLIVAFLMTIEMARDSLARQVQLGTLDERALQGLLYDYEKPKPHRSHTASTTAEKPGNSKDSRGSAQGEGKGGAEHPDRDRSGPGALDGLESLAKALGRPLLHNDHKGKHTT